MIPGRMFRDGFEDYQAFFNYGAGAMCWSKDEEGRRVLWFLAPNVTGFHRPDLARIYMKRSATDWCQPGDVDAWDGNLECPTLQGSIWLHDRRGWHGWITDGNLVTA